MKSAEIKLAQNCLCLERNVETTHGNVPKSNSTQENYELQLLQQWATETRM